MFDRLPLRAPKNIAAVIAALWLALALAVAGGASRADQLGQPIVRGAAIVAIAIVLIARCPLAWGRIRPILILLGLIALLCVLQLVPLPPALWYGLGGRGDFAVLSTTLGLPEVWRPLSLTPDATINALFSLIVPLATAILLAALTPEQLRMLLPGLVAFIGVSAVIGLIQFGSGEWSNPLLNETLGEAAGMFANRNHQSLFLAVGILLLPAWAMRRDWSAQWMRTAIAVALVPFFLLMVLATGSRTGLVLAAIALLLDLWICADTIRGFMTASRKSRSWTIAIAAAGVALVAALALLSTRTRTLDRLFASDAMEDFRFRAFATVQALVGEYLPWGAGLGSFDTVFRAAEPLSLLRTTYFNHAHNDFAEVALETGLPGIALIVGAVIWVAMRAAASQRTDDRRLRRYARTGVSIIVLMLVASVVDYPARVPICMALLVIAAAWLHPDIARPDSARNRHRA